MKCVTLISYPFSHCNSIAHLGGHRGGHVYYNSLLDMYNVRHVNAIVDQFNSVEEVTASLRRAGLESSNIIFGKKTGCNIKLLVSS